MEAEIDKGKSILEQLDEEKFPYEYQTQVREFEDIKEMKLSAELSFAQSYHRMQELEEKIQNLPST